MNCFHIKECANVPDEVVLDHTRKEYIGSRGTAPLILNLCTGWG
jgi:hypothetical protein